MIFVTVGTHEQPFNRLIQYIDELKGEGAIHEDVFIQIGYSTYRPQYCEWSEMLPYEQMVKKVTDARIVIAHGGPASFIMALQMGKIPIVVPRQQIYGEHVNNHQVEFVESVAKRQKNILVVKDVNKLKSVIQNYENLIDSMAGELYDNNEGFCKSFEEIVKELLPNDK